MIVEKNHVRWAKVELDACGSFFFLSIKGRKCNPVKFASSQGRSFLVYYYLLKQEIRNTPAFLPHLAGRKPALEIKTLSYVRFPAGAWRSL